MEMDAKQQAIDTCACPRAPWESLLAPACGVEMCTGGQNPVIFVHRPAGLHCSHLKPFGNGQYCSCERRQFVYSHYGI